MTARISDAYQPPRTGFAGRHNTYYLCQKEEWCDKKPFGRGTSWLVSVQEEDYQADGDDGQPLYCIQLHGVTKDSLDEIRAIMEQKK